jgi:hypothetical protein
LHHVRIILPGHPRDPGNIDQICVERSPHTLLCVDVIDLVAPRFDPRITIAGFVDREYVRVSLPETDPLRKQRWQRPRGTHHGTSLMSTVRVRG